MSIELGRMSVMAIARDNTTADINKDTNPILMEKESISKSREGANKQVISSQADSLIKISRIWADF
ncbi:hypothetical protein, partial [Klebsiella pneumoniae]